MRSALAAMAACATAVASALLLANLELEAAGGFAAAQTLGACWLFSESYHPVRRWATAGCLTATAWILIFVVPAWIYVADPALLEPERSSKATAIVTASLFSVVIGSILARRRRRPAPDPAPRIDLEPFSLNGRRLLACGLAGLAAISVLFALNGGPVAWLANLDKTGDMAAGLTYVIFVGLAIKSVAVVAVCDRWAHGGTIDLRLAGLLAMSLLIVSTLGARAFLAFTFAELLLFYVLVKRPLPLRTIVPAGAAVAFLVIFGLGTVKRYQDFREASPAADEGLVAYATDQAISEAPAAYANNYADGLRHVSTAERLVPDEAPFEYGKAFVRLAVQPIPRSLRPRVRAAPALRRAFEPPGGNQFAIPLQAVSYVQFGLIGVIIVGALAGAVIRQLDTWLLRKRSTLPTLLALIAAAVQVPFVLRTGIPRGLSVSALEVIGLWAVASFVVARWPAPDAAAQAEEASA